MLLNYYKLNYINIITGTTGFISIVILFIILKAMPKRVKSTNENYYKILGLKRFIETASKENLQQLVNQNPNYFYEILPYAYVLGLTKTWINKFSQIINNQPFWYESVKKFDKEDFKNLIDIICKYLPKIMLSQPEPLKIPIEKNSRSYWR